MTKIFLPVNNHVEVKPLKFEKFIASADTTFEEKGEVMSVAKGMDTVVVGDIVYFDSWQCAKYPDSEGNVRYLVKLEDIRAVEYDDGTLPEQPVRF